MRSREIATSSPDPGPPAVAAWSPFIGVAGLATLLVAFGALPRWPGAVHVVAPPPLDLAFDLRLLVARAPSYPSFLLGVVASLAVRSAVLATVLGALGIEGDFRRRWRRAALFYAFSAIPMGVAAGLGFAGLASVYAWYAWAGLGLTALAVPFLMVRATGSIGLRWPLLGIVGLTALGAAAAPVEGPSLALFVPLSAGLTVFLYRRPAGRSAGRPAGKALLAALALVALAAVGPAGGALPTAPGDALLFLVPGVDTSSGFGAMYRFDPAPFGIPCERVFYYSYLGPGSPPPSGDASCPLRRHAEYARSDTQRPLDELVDAFSRQLARIREKAGGAPAVVVTHSQGAVIAWRALAQGGAEGVTHLIALSGFPHSPVGYPQPGQDGAGRVGATVLRGLSAFSRSLDIGTFDPDAPLARQILADPNGLERVFSDPLPAGVTPVMLAATFDAIAAPEGQDLNGVESGSVDTTHVGMVESPDAIAAVRGVLEGRPLPDSVLDLVLRVMLPPWMPPPAGS